MALRFAGRTRHAPAGLRLRRSASRTPLRLLVPPGGDSLLSPCFPAAQARSLTLDIAKALIDEGFHPMTMYFPLVVHGALLIEPTETESKASLDQFIDALRALAERAKGGDVAYFQGAPRLTPRRRLDETAAARKPILRWTPPVGAEALAAE